MNVQPIFELNETEAAFAEAYRRNATLLPGADGGGLKALRDQAIARFEASGLPHRRIEAWHYTDLRRVLRELPDSGEAEPSAVDLGREPLASAFASLEPHRIVFVDGRFAADLSDLGALPPGAEVRALSGGEVPAWAVEAIRSLRPDGEHSVFDLNTALMADGALVHVGAGIRVERPIMVLHLGRADGARHLRHCVRMEADSAVTVVEAYGAVGETDEVTTASVIWQIGDGARVDHAKVQRMAPIATHLAPQIAEVGARATFNTFTLTLGASLAREERHVRIAGEGAALVVSGAYVLDGYQHADMTLVVKHAAPGSNSRELFRGIVDGEARGVFQGRIIVEPGAQKTDARQSVDALLLSEAAEHDSKPELEIYADDVQCAHGATCGELDPNQLFYLRARGLPADEARRLLIAAFVNEALETVGSSELREVLMMLVQARLAELGKEGDDA